MLSPACIRSKPLLMSASGIVCVIIGSISILPSMYQSTIFGTSVRPRAPPNAVPFHSRPVTSWNGRVEAARSGPARLGGRPRRPPARAAERGPLPFAAGDELERPGRDLLAGTGDADDDADAPAAVAAFEGQEI